ncbi:MAG: FG-GAP repeat domain-containing protein [Verrucomicrobiales bacterium]
MKLYSSLIFSLAATILHAQDASSFTHETVDDKIAIGYGIAIADVDGDKKQDILLADKEEIVWYQNPTWKKHVIARKLTALDHVCIASKDIDGDHKAEIAAGAGWNPGDTLNSGAVFYLEPPMSDRSQPWKPIALKHSPTVHRMLWVHNGEGIAHSLVMLPLHGHGNKGGEGEPVKMIEYTRSGSDNGDWKTQEIDTGLHMTHNFDAVQWNKDGGEDMLVGGKEGIYLFTKTNDKWSRKQLAGKEGQNNYPGTGEIRLGQGKDKSRFLAAIEPMHGNQVVVYSDSGAEGKLWNRHVLDDSLNDGHAVACGDLLKLGSDQIVAGWRGAKPGTKVGVKLFTQMGKDSNTWKQTIIDDGGMACEDLKLADLDGDGRLDIIAAGRATKNVKIYWNKSEGSK